MSTKVTPAAVRQKNHHNSPIPPAFVRRRPDPGNHALRFSAGRLVPFRDVAPPGGGKPIELPLPEFLNLTGNKEDNENRKSRHLSEGFQPWKYFCRLPTNRG